MIPLDSKKCLLTVATRPPPTNPTPASHGTMHETIDSVPISRYPPRTRRAALVEFIVNVNRKPRVTMRLDKRIAVEFGLSRRASTIAVQRGHVDVAGHTCLDPARDIEPITPVTYHPSRPRPETIARRLRVLFEDRDILIVDKPAGLLTQPTPDRERDTLLERGAGRYLSQKRGLASPYVGIVHRIDKLTSGVILLVCSPRALRPFQGLFRSHAIERRISPWSTASSNRPGERLTGLSWPTAATAAAASHTARSTAFRQSRTTR